MKTHVLPLVVALMATPLCVSAADAPKPVGQQILVKVEPQPWQTRRAVFADTIDALGASQGKDAVAMARFDGMLTDFEKNPLSLTPMEAMDYYGIFYVPREGATHTVQILQMVSFFATLGWYDALRFADDSGRAEIIDNEFFFNRAYRLGGQQQMQLLSNFLTTQPQQAAQAVQAGIAMARNARAKTDKYDEHWPTAYGLQRMMCGLEGKKGCPKPPALPQAQWDGAFAKAVATVENYYRDNSGRK